MPGLEPSSISTSAPVTGRQSPIFAHLGEQDVFLTRKEAAEYLRLSVPTLERWAGEGVGPSFRKVGGRLLYPLPGLRRFATGKAA